MAASDPLPSFLRQLTESFQQGTFVRLLLTSPVASGGVERVIGRLAEIKGGNVLSLTLREAKLDTTRNLEIGKVAGWLNETVPAQFRGALLETTRRNWQITTHQRGGLRLVAHPASTTVVPARSHDRQKSAWLDEGAQPWLTALGVCDAEGKVLPSMSDKHRQIERYLEIFSHLVSDCQWRAGKEHEGGELVARPVAPPLTIVDMGCGKGYLTFGVWYLLNRILRFPAKVIGVETRRELVERSNAVARSVAGEGLSFVQGHIASAELPQLDALIALHACNTATDDAIRRGIALGAKLIVVSPCCHQELRPQLGTPEPFAEILKHGIMAERLSEWLTDGLRALHLEAAGYATKVIEFVSSEHTPRNLLIAGIRREPGSGNVLAGEAAGQLKKLFGIQRQALDQAPGGEPA